MFKINDQVNFGIRYSNGVRRGGIVRLKGRITSIDTRTITVVSQNSEYKFRNLKNGWVEQSERNDPRGRLYLTLEDV